MIRRDTSVWKERALVPPDFEGSPRLTVSCGVSMDFPIWHKLPTCPAGSREQKNWRLDLLLMCHYYNYCYYSTAVFSKPSP